MLELKSEIERKSLEIFAVTEHASWSAFEDAYRVAGDNPDGLNGFLLYTEVRKYFAFWATRLVFMHFENNEDLAKIMNFFLFSIFEEKWNMRHSDIEEYARSIGTTEESQIFPRKIGSVLINAGAVEIFQIYTKITPSLHSFIETFPKIFELPE